LPLAGGLDLLHLGDGLALEHEQIFQFIHQPERLHRTHQRLQRGLAAALQLAQRTQREAGHLRQFVLRQALGQALCTHALAQGSKDLVRRR